MYPTQTTAYKAVCLKGSCKSKPSGQLVITVSVPATPIVEADKNKICLGDSVVLTTRGCVGEVIWSNGMMGKTITVHPIATAKYTATCRTEGCVSCFADDIIIAVMGGEPLFLKASQPIICQGQSSILSATGNCAGQIKWSTNETGRTITVRPEHTTDYWALCEAEGCVAVKSSLSIQVSPPSAPIVNADKRIICAGELLTLSAEGCVGTVIWSNKMEGSTISVTPTETIGYTALCEQGTCRSSESSRIIVTVQGSVPLKPQVVTELKNECPFTTVDLSSAIKSQAFPDVIHEAHMSNSPSSPLVTEVGAIAENRTYYLFARTKEGCYSESSLVNIVINACQNPLPGCATNPATATIVKTELTASGNFSLEGKLGGIASNGQWKSNGTGTFNTASGLSVIYTPSPEDRQAGNVSIQFSSDDPDGDGPCKAGVEVKELKIKAMPVHPKEMIGVNKLVKSWSRIATNLFEIEYTLQIVNMGKSNLTAVQLTDSLDKVFKNGAVITQKPIVKTADLPTNTLKAGGLDTTFTGQNGNYTLLTQEAGALLPAQTWTLHIKTVVNIANAADSIFYNTAYAHATDVNGILCADQSVNGNWPDLNQNEDPTDDAFPTALSLNSLRDTGNDFFIPEGFSPNSDGINDFLIVKKPEGITVSLEVYNRWGGLVYQSNDYKNNWNGGIAAQNNVSAGTYFYVVRFSDGREFSKFLTINR
ncbi:gliding motility-associated C-terminal domain-containing protein [Runella slithyformis]|uniref:gliding motility-associated C-terminal domain-containing protein n=1 Tax=Runella slithyformis TaxID=106 RepID=UPI00059DEE5B|nr:T9SS C-terminal target domain-containing protein [Runella slithyformis]